METPTVDAIIERVGLYLRAGEPFDSAFALTKKDFGNEGLKDEPAVKELIVQQLQELADSMTTDGQTYEANILYSAIELLGET